MKRVPFRVLCFGAMLAAVPSLSAGETETRVFSVVIENRPAGEFRMTTQANADGSLVLTGSGNLRVKLPIGQYRYSYQGTETWKEGKLLKLESTSDDNGRRRQLEAAPLDGKLRVVMNGHRSDVRADVWTSSFMLLPPASRRPAQMVVLDTEGGRELACRFESLGVEKVTILNQALDCVHCRVTGSGVHAELWYDGTDRLVRQESIEEGRRVRVSLIQLQR